MLITPVTEQALIDLARRGLWLKVHDGRLQIITTRQDAGTLTDDLRAQLASQRDELLEWVPALESEGMELTGPVVRILFARLSDEVQRHALDLHYNGNRKQENEQFYANCATLTIEQKVVYLWAFVYTPGGVVARPKGVAA